MIDCCDIELAEINNLTKLLVSAGFLSWGNCHSPPPLSPFFDQSLFPQLSFIPQNFKNFTSLFSPFWLLFSSKLHQKALFYAWNTKICSNLVVGDIFGLSGQFFQVPPPHLTLSLARVPPSDSLLDGDRKLSLKVSPPPTKILWKNPAWSL